MNTLYGQLPLFYLFLSVFDLLTHHPSNKISFFFFIFFFPTPKSTPIYSLYSKVYLSFLLCSLYSKVYSYFLFSLQQSLLLFFILFTTKFAYLFIFSLQQILFILFLQAYLLSLLSYVQIQCNLYLVYLERFHTSKNTDPSRFG